MTTIAWAGSSASLLAPRWRIGLIVRGMTRPGATPAGEGHADCVLSNGSPIGFFANSEIPTSGSASSGSATLGARALAASLDGEVWRYARLATERPEYIHQGVAAANDVVSTLLAIDVSDGERARFERAWAAMEVDPGQFGIVGANCSTHAGYAFSAAGLLTSYGWTVGSARTAEIEGMDTPTNLFHQLFRGPANGRIEVYTGYLGFEPVEHIGCRITIQQR